MFRFLLFSSLLCLSLNSVVEAKECGENFTEVWGDCYAMNRWDFTFHSRSSGIDHAAYGENADGGGAAPAADADPSPGPSPAADSGPSPAADGGPDADPGPGPGCDQ